MDKALELRLIEEGFDPIHKAPLTLDDVPDFIGTRLLSNEYPHGLIFFDGQTSITVRTGSGHTVIEKADLAVCGGDDTRGIYVYAPNEPLGHRSSVFVDMANVDCAIKPFSTNPHFRGYFDLMDKSKAPSAPSVARFEISLATATAISYLSRIDTVESDKLFWAHIADRIGLKFKTIPPKYTDKSPLTDWYTAEINDGRISTLTLGTRFRVYAIRANFQAEQSADSLRRVSEGLHVQPQTVDDQWVGGMSMIPGKSFETHVDIGRGDMVVAYLERLLRK